METSLGAEFATLFKQSLLACLLTKFVARENFNNVYQNVLKSSNIVVSKGTKHYKTMGFLVLYELCEVRMVLWYNVE